MKPYALIASFGVAIHLISPALAVPPATVDQTARINWSQPLEDPFEGPIVYDKDFGDGYATVTSWSWRGIRATYTRYWREIVGYRTVWKTRQVRDSEGNQRTVRYSTEEPIYEQFFQHFNPTEIQIALNNQVYRYTEGPVPPELAAALATAPAEALTIRLVYADGKIQPLKIGRRTVESWKTIFNQPPQVDQSDDPDVALAGSILPAPVTQEAKIAWSQAIDDPFDGRVVYDKNFGSDFALVSQWSPRGIRVTYTRFWREIVGYQTVWKTQTIKTSDGNQQSIRYPEQEPVYRQFSEDRVPAQIQLALNGQFYTYAGGLVPEDLAAALASAPSGNQQVRLIWPDNTVMDTQIGAATVAAWRKVFSP